jgi:hypothetical protein
MIRSTPVPERPSLFHLHLHFETSTKHLLTALHGPRPQWLLTTASTTQSAPSSIQTPAQQGSNVMISPRRPLRWRRARGVLGAALPGPRGAAGRRLGNGGRWGKRLGALVVEGVNVSAGATGGDIAAGAIVP